MHQAISINTLCFEPGSLDRHIDMAVRLGTQAISPAIEDVVAFGAPKAARLLRDTGLTVATLTHRAFSFATSAESVAACERLDRTIEIAAAIDASSITMTTGGRDGLMWPMATARFAEAIAPCAAHARDAGIKLAIEPTSHLYADVSIAHRLADTVTIARQADIALGIDIFACWFDSDIEEAIAAAGPIAALVQVSDHVAGDRGLPCRAVPGDGMVPLERLLPALIAGGFAGPFDLEIIGPRLAAEGHERGLQRAGAYIGAILIDAGLPF